MGRAREWFDAAHHAGVRVYTLPAIGEGGQAALLAAFRGELPKDVHPPSLRILSADAGVVLTEVELDSLVPRHGEYAWMGVGEPVLAPEAGRLLIAHRSKSTILAFDCADWSLAWHEHVPWGGQELEVRGELLFTSADNGEDDCDVRDVRTGAVRFVGTPLGLGRVLGDAEGALLVGQGRDALHVFGPEALQSDPLGTEPLWSLWPHGDEVVVVACDGTWALPSAALDPLARVRFGDRLVAAQPLARWLLDPLHVRSFAADVDPAPRLVPLR